MVRNIEHRENKKVQNKYCKSQITHIIKSAGIVSLIFMQFSLVNKLWVPQQKIEFTNKTGENHMHQHTKAAIHGTQSLTLELQMMMPWWKRDCSCQACIKSTLSALCVLEHCILCLKTDGRNLLLLEVNLMPHQSKSCMCYHPLSPWCDKTSQTVRLEQFTIQGTVLI